MSITACPRLETLYCFSIFSGHIKKVTFVIANKLALRENGRAEHPATRAAAQSLNSFNTIPLKSNTLKVTAERINYCGAAP
jgi:hypothetical protein